MKTYEGLVCYRAMVYRVADLPLPSDVCCNSHIMSGIARRIYCYDLHLHLPLLKSIVDRAKKYRVYLGRRTLVGVIALYVCTV